MKTCLAAAAAVLIATTVAGSAADLAVKAVPYVAPPPSSINWTGFYIGINSGYAFGASDVQYSSAPTFFNPAQFNAPIFAANYAALSTGSLSANRDGFIGGGQIGYNWQFSRLVTGIEADIQALTGSANQATVGSRVDQFTNTYNSVIAASSKLTYLGTLRGRLGYIVTAPLLAYATGGLAYGGVKANFSNVESISNPNVQSPATAFGSTSSTIVGWTIGAGIEWMFAPNWSAKVEYDYYDLGRATFATSGIAPLQLFGAGVGTPLMINAQTVSNSYNGNIARAGVNYKFN